MKKLFIMLLVAANQLAAMSNVGRSVWRAGKACLSTMQKVQLARPVVASNALGCGSSNVIYSVKRPFSVVPSVAYSQDPRSAGINLAYLMLFGVGGTLLIKRSVQAEEGSTRAEKAAENLDISPDLLQDLIRQGSLWRIKYVIDHGADVNRSNRYGETPLWVACSHGDLDIVKYLVERGANVNVNNRRFGQTPLWQACFNRNLDIVQYLVEHGADVNTEISNGSTPLLVALSFFRYDDGDANFDLVKYLVEHGADVNNAPALQALCITGRLDIVKYFVEHGVDVNKKNCNGETLLWTACRYGNLDIVKYLVEHGADLNRSVRDGETLLWAACSYGSLDIVKYLVERGVDVNRSGRDGETPLWAACSHRRLDIIEYLVEHGADVNKKNSNGETLLWAACRTGSLDMVKYLVEHGADVNRSGRDGETPLWVACSHGSLDIIEYLVEHGADVNRSGRDGATPLWVASQNGRLDIIKYLVERGADVNKALEYLAQTGVHNLPDLHFLIKLCLQIYDSFDSKVQQYLKQSSLFQACCSSELSEYRVKFGCRCISEIVQLEADIHARGNYAFAHGCPKEHGLYRIFATELYNATHNKLGFKDGYVAPRFVQQQTDTYMQKRLETRNYNNSDYLFCQPTALHGCSNASGVSPLQFFLDSFSARSYIINLSEIALLYGIDEDLVQKYENRFKEVEQLYYSLFAQDARHGLLVEYEVSAEFAKNYMRYRHLYSRDEKLSGSSYEYIQKGEYNPATEHIIPTGFLMRPEVVNKHVTTHLVGIDRSSDQYKKFEQACKQLIQDLLAENKSFQMVYAMFERQGMHTDWN